MGETKQEAAIRVGITFENRDDYLVDHSFEHVAELTSPAVIAHFEATLNELGYHTTRIGDLRALQGRLGNGERWDVVFNYSEGLYGRSRSAQIPALLDAYRIEYTFADATSQAICLHKEFAKRIVRDNGVPTPNFVTVSSKTDCEKINGTIQLKYPLFVKPIAEGSSMGVYGDSKVNDSSDLWPRCERIISKFNQPALVEEFMPGREITVGIVGTGDDARVLGAMETVVDPAFGSKFNTVKDQEIVRGIYCFASKFNDCLRSSIVDDDQAKLAATYALKAYRSLGGRDCGRVDMRLDEKGVPNFLECNTDPGLSCGKIPSDIVYMNEAMGGTYKQLIGSIVSSALSRARSKQQLTYIA